MRISYVVAAVLTICGVALTIDAAGPTQVIDWKKVEATIGKICGVTPTLAATGPVQEIDWKKVDVAMGRTAAVSGDVHRFGFPRTDLQVTLDGVTIRPALALGGWAAFTPVPNGAMVMGDLVLLETEVNPVMAKLLEGGLEITAIHNHLLRANPATFYMHIGGHGDPVKMAEVIRAALTQSKVPPPFALMSGVLRNH